MSWRGACRCARTPASNRTALLYRRAASGSRSGGTLDGRADAQVRNVIDSPGQSLTAETRAPMEKRLGYDLSGVRVHTGAAAAESAHGLDADAYTVGRDVVFGAGRFAPRTPAGQHLLAHELTHVAQQNGAQPGTERISVAPQDSPREREAASVATGFAGEKQPSAAPGAEVQRSVAGDVAGGTIGAGLGAGAGALLGGPAGAVVGGLLGGIAGLAIGDLLSADKRSLTSGEKAEAKLVFGDNLNYSSVSIADATILSRITKGNAVTPFETIYFPAGYFAKDYSPDLNGMAWLIHEMTHAWQSQHGVSVLEKVFTAAHSAKVYDYGGEQGLKSAAQQGRTFTSFNTEQQGDILRNYYVALKTNQDISAFAPFIDEVQGGSRAHPVLDDRNLKGPAPTSAVA